MPHADQLLAILERERLKQAAAEAADREAEERIAMIDNEPARGCGWLIIVGGALTIVGWTALVLIWPLGALALLVVSVLAFLVFLGLLWANA